MQNKSFYYDAHLFVAAIRLFEHQKTIPPSIDDVCKMLSISAEHGHHMCRRLEDLDIINVVDSAFGNKLFVKNHLKIEDIDREEKRSRLDEELKKFQDSKNEILHKIETIKSEQSEKKKNLFTELEKNLKKEIDKK